MLVQTMPTRVTIHLLHVQYHPFLMGIKLSSSRGRCQGCYIHGTCHCPQPNGNRVTSHPSGTQALWCFTSFCHSDASLLPPFPCWTSFVFRRVVCIRWKQAYMICLTTTMPDFKENAVDKEQPPMWNAGKGCSDGPETPFHPQDHTTVLQNKLSLHLQSRCTTGISSGRCSPILGQSKFKGKQKVQLFPLMSFITKVSS